MHPSLRPELRTYLAALLLGLFAAAVVVAAKDAFEASLFGLRLWLEAVLPALMPFFALSEILAAFGVIHFIGVLLEPLMRPLFNIPGAGAFAFAMGLVSGYPLGAIITARLCKDRLCNSVEGERLVALANTADPLFMAGVVAAGFFQVPELGGVLSVAHYLGVLLVGFSGAFHDRGAPETPPIEATSREGLLRRALAAMLKAHRADGRPFGQVLGDAVRSAMHSMLLIGGTIILFSVLLRVLARVGIVPLLSGAAGWVGQALGLDRSMGEVLVRGLFEITNGTQSASQARGSLVERAALASFVIGWSGLAVHTQVAAVVQGTGIRLGPYLRARFLHGVLAAIITVALMALGMGPAVGAWAAPAAPAGPAPLWWTFGALMWRMKTAALLLGLLVVAATAGAVVRRLVAWGPWITRAGRL
ncbi:nucleoside recognition domain-containing protein [Carboxydochorda subterranea]|uniref:Nucleoside recognition domain-containing protein n=1 Tax=Carboxydichorda subterranea TaxID=3109565 RepID=A0ABZ1C1S1_9FIRM|nr:nucleoside recognition domain-containing protein [Limnochorda sp. L945t]WRP18917.1 nucleoside recognition domain-containing protein [Limnochorda sp. L945t]